MNIIITGASSGLGLGFLKHYASEATNRITALDIRPLPATVSSLPNATFRTVDISSPASLASIQQGLKDTPIHLIVHSAGIRGLVPSIVREQRGHVDAAETWEVMDHETMMRTLEINAWGSFNLIRTFLPNLRLAAASGQTLPSMPPPKVVLMSSRMGSISANTAGGGYAYRSSKAALNAMVKSFSLDVPEVVFLMLHPGRVETGLVQWKEEGAMSVEESLSTCVKVVEEVGLEGSGGFVDRWGKRIEW